MSAVPTIIAVYAASVALMIAGLNILVRRGSYPPAMFPTERAVLKIVACAMLTVGTTLAVCARPVADAVPKVRTLGVVPLKGMWMRAAACTTVTIGVALFFTFSGTKKNNLTREFVHLIVSTVICILIGIGAALFELVSFIRSVQIPKSRKLPLLLLGLIAMVFIMSSSQTVSTIVADETLIELLRRDIRATVTGGTFEFPCQGKRKVPPTATLGYLPRRVINFFTGSEMCPGWNYPRFSLYANDGDHGVIVPLRCPNTGGKPRVVIHDFTRNALGYLEKLELDEEGMAEFHQTSKLWRAEVDASVARGDYKDARVNRGKNGAVDSIEEEPVTYKTDPAQLLKVAEFSAFRSKFPNDESFARIPFRSGVMSIFCGDDEEYHINRKIKPLKQQPEQRSGEAPVVDGVTVLMLDAVSRQDFLRLMPKSSLWLRSKMRKGKKYTISEFPGYTTVGHSTSKNFVALVGGRTLEGDYKTKLRARSQDALKQHNWFKRIKADRPEVRTTFLSGVCTDVVNVYFGTQSQTSTGFGGPHEEFRLDDYIWSPHCHSSYGPFEGNFVGPNSLQKRCIAKDYVHDHMFGFLDEYMAQQRLPNGRHNPFLTVATFQEGHEGSHAVLNTMDDRLLAFLKDLESTGYFDSSALMILSDHGNHMGPYFEWSLGGKYERTTPALITILPSAAIRDPDQFAANQRKIVTPNDVHGTVLDLLGIRPKVVDGDGHLTPGYGVKPTDGHFPSLMRDIGRRQNCRDAAAEAGCSLVYMCEQP